MTSDLQLPTDATRRAVDDAADFVGSVGLFRGLGLESRLALAAAGQSVRLAPGERLFAEGCGADALYLLREGLLHAHEPDPPREPRLVRVIRPGEAVDGLQELGGGKNAVAVHAVESCSVTAIPGGVVDLLVESKADVKDARDRLHRHQLLCRLHRLFGPLDEALLADLEAEADWVNLQRGEVLFEAGAPSDGLFFLISGRLAALRVFDDGQEELSAEIGRGETVGEAGFFTGKPRGYRARALRDSVLVAYTSVEFERLISRHPHVVRYITAGVAERAASPHRTSRAKAAVPAGTTIVLVGAGRRAPVRAFADRLSETLSRFGEVMRLDSKSVGTLLTEPGIAQATEHSPEEQRLLAWLEGLESRYRFVICEADDVPSAWSRRCARRADRLLLVADARELHTPNDVECALLPAVPRATDVRATLVLIHPDGSRPPSGTRYWLDARPAVSEHYHVRWTEHADFQRIGRVLAGRSIGLVLGGGGARGFAHIGILRAFGEAGIPIDTIGGTSMGASIAGQFAMGRGADEITATTRKVFLEVKPHRGFTLPILSLVNSRRTALAGRICYGDVEMEDLWLPFFCVSSNLTTADVLVHRRGVLWKAALASSSLPGVGTPVLHQRQLLVDGGVLNNLPTDEMRRSGCGTVIASVVSFEDPATFTFERVPTVWEVLRTRFGRTATGGGPRFPSILDVVLRASLLHSVYHERLNVLEADLCVRPAVAGFGLLEFERLDEIVAAGYAQAEAAIARWREEAVPVFG